MKPIPVLVLVLVAGLAAAGGWIAAKRQTTTSSAAAGAAPERKLKFYQSPMHPWIKSDQPGKCTICGMALVAVYEGEKGFDAEAGLVTLTPASAAVVGVQTAEARRAPLVKTLRVTGTLVDDETRHRIVAAYVDGRIEKLHVNFLGAEVVAGQPLALLYSPELFAAKREFHLLVHAPGVMADLLAGAREKLRRLGLVEAQIDALAAGETVDRNTELLAPLGGTVVARNAAAYEGAYVKTGDRLFEIGDLASMWFQFDAYEPDLAWLRVGQTVAVTLPSLPGRALTAPIAFIDPNLNEMTRTARVRVVLPNPQRTLLLQQTAAGLVQLDAPEVLTIPRSAVLATSARPIVYVDRGGGAYEPRSVELGRSGDTLVEVRGGLVAGDRVVTQGALILDGQAQLAQQAAGGSAPEKETPAPASSPPPSDPAALQPLALALADAADALAADDLARYRQELPKLRAAFAAYGQRVPGAADGDLGRLAAALADGPDLKAARTPFEPYSTALADLVRATRLPDVHVFQCPMSPVLGKGRWVQRGAKLRNPFFGSEMLTCGTELR
jgi:Cu(I)/Ag(I) efflux system membrane fusion protein